MMKRVWITWLFGVAFWWILGTALRTTTAQDFPGPPCSASWFGSQCQYKCHCLNDACDESGECVNGTRCERGWFGPACQYVDLTAQANVAPSLRWLTDGNKTTCNDDSSGNELTVTLNAHFYITWLRIQTNDAGELYNISMHFSNTPRVDGVTCVRRDAKVDSVTLDVYCDLNVTVNQVTLKGEGVKSLCSLYISGGRNVALRQTTLQSSTFENASSFKAVDGNRDGNYFHNSCTHTEVKKNSPPNWNVTLSRPHNVDRYVLYNRVDSNQARLHGFILTSFAENGTDVFTYKDTERVMTIYNVPSTFPKTPVAGTKINVTNAENILTLCEVEMYGDSVCPKGKYGRDCERTCRCADESESCFVSTGGCPSGCSDGYQGVGCSQGEASTSLDLAVIIGPIVAGVILIILVVVGVIIWRRRKHRKRGNSKTVDAHEEEMKTTRHADDGGFSELAPKAPEVAVSPLESDEPADAQVEDVQSNLSGGSESSLPDSVGKPAVKPKVPGKKPTADNVNGNKRNTNVEGAKYYNFVQGLKSTSIPVGDLDTYMSSHNKEFFKEQFGTIPANLEATTKIGLSGENKLKNRYKNICAYDHSRVHLEINKRKKHGDYINANYVEGYKGSEMFIASQGPTKNIMEDFVRMLWEQEVDRVVMLTKLIEEGKQKCERYWPEDDVMEVGDITVELTTTQVFADYTIRRLRLRMAGMPVQELTQFHFTSWPDKDVPTTPWGLVDFEQRVASYPSRKPIVVHCSAGVGRTGTFIALRNVMREAEDTGHIDFFTTVQKLRKDRIFMVQTSDQYEFLHRAAQVAIVCMGTTVTSDDIQKRLARLENKSGSGQSNMEMEFKAICNVCDQNEEKVIEDESADSTFSVYQNSRTVTNKLKNRLSNILPKENYRVRLFRETRDLEDYINAVFVPSFTKQDHHILTQLPLPTTVIDFWRLVTQYKVSLIVAFELDLGNTDSSIGKYLPASDGESLILPLFEIKSQPPTPGDFLEQREIIISANPEKKNIPHALEGEQRVIHLKCTSNDLDPKTLLTMIRQIRSLRPVGEGRIIYMCRNGADCSGLICVLSLLLDRIDNDRRLTVPLVVGAMKAVRPQVIPTLDQYRCLYQALKRNNETTNVYSNFGDSQT